MRELIVADVMTRQVITAVPDTPFKELVGVMITHDVDAVPVVDAAGRPVGVVAEADALTKLEFHGGTDLPPLLAGSRRRARWYRAQGLTASDLMTAPALTTTENALLERAVRAMTDHCVRRLCVVDRSGLLVGVVTRRDALTVFVRSDGAILADIEHQIAGWPREASAQVVVGVAGRVVTLDGSLALHSAVERAGGMVGHVPGVVAVLNRLRHDVDDLMITGL